MLNVSSHEMEVGMVLERNKEQIKYIYVGFKINEIKAEFSANSGLFMFVHLNDYHQSVSDYGCTSLSDYKGQIHLSNAFEILFTHIEKDNFDYIFIFSDHGCKLP